MRNTILWSPNAKYHDSYLFFYKINKGHLLLMYSCVFRFEISDLVVFFGCYCLTPVTLFIIWSKDSSEKQPAVRTLSIQRQVRPENPSNRRFFSTRGKLLSSPHRSKHLKATHVTGTFPQAMSKIPSVSGHCDMATRHDVGPRSNFPRPRVAQSN